MREAPLLLLEVLQLQLQLGRDLEVEARRLRGGHEWLL